MKQNPAFFVINSEELIISFECKKSLFRNEKLYIVKSSNDKISVSVKIWQDKKIVIVNCYSNDTELFSQALPYCKGRKYSITYKFDIEKELLIFDNSQTKIDFNYGVISEHYVNVNGKKERVYVCEKVLSNESYY